MLICIDVKFIFDSVHLGLSSSADILQIADVTLRVFDVISSLNTKFSQIWSSVYLTGYGELCVCF